MTCPGRGYCLDMNDSLRVGLDSMVQQVADQVAEVKPHLRGWLHLATAPLTLAAGIVLIVLSPTATTRWGSAVYIASAVLLSAATIAARRSAPG